MAKATAKSKIEIKEVETQKVDNRITLDSIVDQLGKKAGALARAPGARSKSAERLARIKELSDQLAAELRALRETPPPAKAPRKRSKPE